MNFKKILSAILAAATFGGSAFAATVPDTLTTDFCMGEYTHTTEPEYAVIDSTTAGKNKVELEIDLPDMPAEHDGIFLSFYYRSKSSFGTYTGIDTETKLRLNGAEWAFQPLKPHSQDNQYNHKIYARADDEWHRVQMTADVSSTVLNGITNQKLKISLEFTSTSNPAYIEFAGFRAGVLKFNDDPRNNNRMFTEVSWHMMKSEPDAIVVDGTQIPLEEGKTTYTAPGTLSSTVGIASQSGVKADIVKTAYNTYEITTYAGGYDPAKDENGETTFRLRYNNGSFSGEYSYPVMKNSELTKKYTVVLDIPAVNSDMLINGSQGNSLEYCGEGDYVVINITYSNLEHREYSYKTLMILRKDEKIVSVIPYTVTLAQDEPSKSDSHVYTLPASTLPSGDYSGVTVDYYVVDTSNMADVR